jgi:Ran GTPase-activating protein (RanGAP) involved in mRNA processing and transport
MNGIFVDGAISIGEALKDKKYLEVIVLKRNEIGIHGMRSLKEVLYLSKTIKELNLAGNKIGDEGCIMVCDALMQKQNQSLTYLNLSDNQITCKGAAQVAELIKKCKTLEELYLSTNNIANDGARQIAAALKTRRDFKTIDIDNNKFSGAAILELFSIMPVGKLNLVR